MNSFWSRTFFLSCLTLLAACVSQPSQETPPSEKKTATAPISVAKKNTPQKRHAYHPEVIKEIEEIDQDRAIFFAPGIATLDPASRAKLERIATELKADPEMIAVLTGHTDDLGSPNYNIAISEQRTRAVASQLQSLGIPLKRMRRYSVGSEKNPKNCQSIECRAKMRRVDVDYTDD